MRHEVQRSISPNHPSLAGHFPGNPVVPGVVILSELLRATESWLQWSTSAPIAVTSVKFMRLLRPSEPFTLLLEQRSQSTVSFAVLRERVCIASGTLQHNHADSKQGR